MPQAATALKEISTTSTLTNDVASRAKDLLALHHSIQNGLNFDLAKELALDCMTDILEHWLPDGEYRGRQYLAYNPNRCDSEIGSFTINTENGIWADFATDDKGGDLISLVKYVGGYPNQVDAAEAVLKFIAEIDPKSRSITTKRHPISPGISSENFSVVMPVPENAKAPNAYFGVELGTPSMRWVYKNATGQMLFYVLRFDTKPRKTILPYAYCKDASGHFQWKMHAPSAPRPAYGLDRLAAHPEAPVLFTEGEKAADAAQRLFPGYVAVTTMNGAQSPEKTDFTPFAGRRIYIAPDNDEAGMSYKDKLIDLLRSAGAHVVAVMRLERLKKNEMELPSGYDLADAENDGWTAEAFALLEKELWEAVSGDKSVSPASTASAKNATSAASTKKKTPLEFANDFAMQSYQGNVAAFNNQILAYSNGFWSALNPDVDVKRPLLTAMGTNATASKVNGVFELVKIQYASKAEMFDRNSPLICLNNGTLNPLTGELLPHAVEHYLTNKLDIHYDAQAECPLWLQTLDEIFAPDSDKSQKIQLLQEYMGYCLIPDTRMHKFLWMVGAGGNGKSLVLEMITALVGKVNISYAQIERLQEKFVRAELQGKLVNISSEMSAQATVSDGYLKQITAGDIIEAERKNERPFSFKPYARLIGATNVLPRLLDHSDGFFRRAMILRFNRQFTEAERDNQRGIRLLGELPGILNWAISGLQNLLKRGSFIGPDSSEAEVRQYRVHSDPVRQFSEEFLTVTKDKDRWVSSGTLYDNYKTWSSENGYKTLASNQFAERLVSVGFRKCRTNTGRYWEAEYSNSPLVYLPLAASSAPKTPRYIL